MSDRTAAPLDVHAVERAAAPHGFSRNLPREAYTSREVFDWEMTHLWANAWVCAGRSSDLARSGDCKAIHVGGDGILLARGEDGKLRGFYNVCRHRGHELLEAGPCAHMSTIRCPYHGWTYALDGALRIAPRTADVPGFRPEEFPLVPARIEEWHGWVWVNASSDAVPLADYLGELDALVAPFEPERLRAAVEKSYDVGANWKLVHENYHECYHCAHIHPQLCKVSPPESGKNWERPGAWIGGRMDLADFAVTMSLDGRSDGVPLRGITGDAQRKVDYYGVVPNIFLSLHPDYVLTHRLEPLAPDKVRIECQWLFPPEAFEKPAFSHEYAFKFWDITNYQDWRALEGVQRGVSSRGYRPGPLTMKEDAVHQFVSRMARAYLEGGFDPAPRRASAPCTSTAD
jgi:Rieske 2Fe-2S family protein